MNNLNLKFQDHFIFLSGKNIQQKEKMKVLLQTKTSDNTVL